MITFFPTPYPDEILYSVFARYHDKSPNFNGSETAKDLFNVNRIGCSIEFPSRLVTLLENIPFNSSYNVNRLLFDHTLYSFYTAFLTPKKARLIKEYMLHKKGDIYNKVTNIINPLAENKFLRFCPKCNQEALNKYGEVYWHRVHQIRGIFICPIHKSPIYNSTVSPEENKYKYTAATEENCVIHDEIKYESKLHEKLGLIAKDMYYIMNNPEIKTNIKEQYLNQLKILKYATVNGGLRQRCFIADFEAFWGNEILEMTYNTITKTNNCNWLLEMGWDRPLTGDSLKHILLMRFLGLPPSKLFNKKIDYLPFGKPSYPCLNPVCVHYERDVIENVEIRNSYKTKSPIGYFTCPLCGFSYLRRGPDQDNEDRYRYSRIVDYGDYWREELKRLLKRNSVLKTAKIMGTTHTTIYSYLKNKLNR